jgi:hypothetical protein
MKYLLILISFTIMSCSSTYLKVGAGYKFQETKVNWLDGSKNHPISARIEVGNEVGRVTYGVSHHSQWLVGKPINSNYEYSKTELFIDYKFGGK